MNILRNGAKLQQGVQRDTTGHLRHGYESHLKNISHKNNIEDKWPRNSFFASIEMEDFAISACE
jgi:hypothetical protein